ncbi:hypothetical protein NE237_027927 [Protea cynaroides]|uniref:Uncharacterized protein n=1 Tax=Protea cynaroides TaxID=273540 RepID=A0A9Q0JUN6_9MAGN|nr:hypothetical protein NE237_027927 [Protea cynaroides]
MVPHTLNHVPLGPLPKPPPSPAGPSPTPHEPPPTLIPPAGMNTDQNSSGPAPPAPTMDLLSRPHTRARSDVSKPKTPTNGTIPWPPGLPIWAIQGLFRDSRQSVQRGKKKLETKKDGKAIGTNWRVFQEKG